MLKLQSGHATSHIQALYDRHVEVTIRQRHFTHTSIVWLTCWSYNPATPLHTYKHCITMLVCVKWRCRMVTSTCRSMYHKMLILTKWFEFLVIIPSRVQYTVILTPRRALFYYHIDLFYNSLGDVQPCHLNKRSSSFSLKPSFIKFGWKEALYYVDGSSVGN